MSSWGQGGTRQGRRARATVLNRDGYQCQLRLPGCIGEATEAHHVRSIAAAGQTRNDATDPDGMVAVCVPCHKMVTERQRRAAIATQRGRRTRPTPPHPGD